MSRTVNQNAITDGQEKQDISRGPKPFCERVRLSNGKLVTHGVGAAARWLGVTPAALSALARGVNAIPITWEARARAEFPELFGAKTISGNVSPDAP